MLIATPFLQVLTPFTPKSHCDTNLKNEVTRFTDELELGVLTVQLCAIDCPLPIAAKAENLVQSFHFPCCMFRNSDLPVYVAAQRWSPGHSYQKRSKQTPDKKDHEWEITIAQYSHLRSAYSGLGFSATCWPWICVPPGAVCGTATSLRHTDPLAGAFLVRQGHSLFMVGAYLLPLPNVHLTINVHRSLMAKYVTPKSSYPIN